MTTSTKPEPIPGKTFFIALVQNGRPEFAPKPVAHESAESAQDEVDRLAALHPGKVFQAFQALVHKVTPGYVEPKPKVKTFTGAELHSTAPVGVYRRTDSEYSKSRFVVFGEHDARTVLFVCGLGPIEAMSKVSWNSTPFAPTGEDAATVLAQHRA